jgi:glutathione synthase/RimK-type ligase-like ATP-grasp enzyme
MQLEFQAKKNAAILSFVIDNKIFVTNYRIGRSVHGWHSTVEDGKEMQSGNMDEEDEPNGKE